MPDSITSSGRRLARLAALTFIVSFSSGMTGPIFPLHAQALGATYQQVGMVSAAGSLIHAGLAFRAGWLADKLGYELMFLLSSLTIVLSGLAYFFSRTLFLATIGKALDSLFIASYWPALEGASHDAGDAAGQSFGLMYSAYPAATFAASAATGWLAGRLGYRASFAGALIGGVTAVGVVAAGFGVDRKRVAGAAARAFCSRGAGGKRREGPRPGIVGGSGARYASALAACFAYCVLVAQVLTFAPLLAEARGLRVELVGLLVGAFWLGRTVISLPAGMLADRAGYGVVFIPAFVAGAAGSAIMALFSAPLAMFAGVALTGLCAGAVAPVAMLLGAECAAPGSQGWALGLCETFCGLGFIGSGLVGGVLAGWFGPSAPFTSGAVVCAVVAAGLVPVFAGGRGKPTRV